jgi:hypothetical protein
VVPSLRRSTTRITRAGILGEMHRSMQRRLDALRRQPAKEAPGPAEVEASKVRWDAIRTEIPVDELPPAES